MPPEPTSSFSSHLSLLSHFLPAFSFLILAFRLVAGELFRLPLGRRLCGVLEGHAVGEHQAEPAAVRPGSV